MELYSQIMAEIQCTIVIWLYLHMLWVVLRGVRHVKTAIFSAVVLYVLTEH